MKYNYTLLDAVLKHLISQSSISENEQSSYDISKELQLTQEDVEMALQYLKEKGFVIHNISTNAFSSTFKGGLYFESTHFLFKNKPFKRDYWSKFLQNIWIVLKSIGVIINGIILLSLSYLTYKNDDGLTEQKAIQKTLEQKLEHEVSTNKMLKDSIIMLHEKNTKEIDKIKK